MLSYEKQPEFRDSVCRDDCVQYEILIIVFGRPRLSLIMIPSQGIVPVSQLTSQSRSSWFRRLATLSMPSQIWSSIRR
jgi:hypothetical protein